MPDPVSGVLTAVTVGGSLLGSRSSSRAARAQTEASEAGIAEQRRQFDQMQRLLQPYVSAGTPALQGMMDLIGLPYGGGGGGYSTPPIAGGATPTAYTGSNTDYYRNLSPEDLGLPAGFGYGLNENLPFGTPTGTTPATGTGVGMTQAQRQNQAIQAQAQNPLFLALAKQGEDAMLQNASATGGLRGGNIQGALAQFRPALLNQFVNQQYDRMAGIASLGQQSAAGVGNAGINTGTNIASLLADAGAARAGNAVSQGNIWSRALGSIGGIATGGGF